MNATLELRAIALRVPDIARSVGFYSDQLGFVVARRDATTAELAVTRDAAPILTLGEDRTAPAAPRDAAGLFHAALRFPHRGALGAWLQRAAERGVEFDGFSDHAVSEAIYFSDPDGNGLEFYADRPRASWSFADGQVQMVTEPLDLKSLIQAAIPASPTLLAGARWGHLHLRVTDLQRSEPFYSETFGMEVTQRSYPGARFLAADQYHHHLGLNIWGHPDQPQPPGALGLAAATFARRGNAPGTEVRDPDGITIRVEPLSP